MAAIRPPLSGSPLEGVDVQDLHRQQLSQMFQSIKITSEDIEEIRQKLKEEGHDAQKIERMIDLHIEAIQKLTGGQIPADTLTQILHEYKEKLTDTVTEAGNSAIRNLSGSSYWGEGHSPKLSARIWFDATPDLRAQKNKAFRDDEETVDAEEPVYEHSRQILDRDQLGAELQAIALETNKQFVSLLRRYPLPSRIVIEWKIACPESSISYTRNVSSYVPILGRSAALKV